jgi:hypothetical protein
MVKRVKQAKTLDPADEVWVKMDSMADNYDGRTADGSRGSFVMLM